MGEVIDFAAWRRRIQQETEWSSLAEPELCGQLQDWAESRGVPLLEAIEGRLLREQRDLHGLAAAGELANLGETPQALDDALHACAASCSLTIEELLKALLDELRPIS